MLLLFLDTLGGERGPFSSHMGEGCDLIAFTSTTFTIAHLDVQCIAHAVAANTRCQNKRRSRHSQPACLPAWSRRDATTERAAVDRTRSSL